jgi:FkbM family methyltransferase
MMIRRLFQRPGKTSFSQCGEDLIIDQILQTFQIYKPTYLDIGAYDPIKLNNTFLFYRRGSSGICVEPNPVLFRRIKKFRPRDACLNVGITGSGEGLGKLFVMSSDTLSTLSKEVAERYTSYGSQHIDQVIPVQLLGINQLFKSYVNWHVNLVSLDVEGNEYEILVQFDFSLFTPDIFCIETLTYTEDHTETKTNNVIEVMTANGYFLYADTYINSIFVNMDWWKNRK